MYCLVTAVIVDRRPGGELELAANEANLVEQALRCYHLAYKMEVVPHNCSCFSRKTRKTRWAHHVYRP